MIPVQGTDDDNAVTLLRDEPESKVMANESMTTANDDGLDIPPALDRTAGKTDEEINAERRAANAKAAGEREIRSPAAAKASAPVNPLVEHQKLIKREKGRVRIEKLKAVQSGATKAMPLQDKDALAKIAEQATVPAPAAKSSWRDWLPIHPAIEALEIPKVDDAELLEIGSDIKECGLKELAATIDENGKEWLADGATRLDSIERVGMEIKRGDPLIFKKLPALLEFCTEKELVAQTGHPPAHWPLVVLKELVDNALDSREEVGIAPVIAITVDNTGITVMDNGPGIPAETVKGVLDFTARVSSRDAYVSPTRGAQGNALKTIVAMPFVLDGRRGRVEIETCGIRHAITFEVDHVRQEPVVHHEPGQSEIKTGTMVRVPWRGLAKADFDDETDCEMGIDWKDLLNSPRSIPDAKSRFLQIATDYTWLNPNAAITVDWFGERIAIAATDPAWSKWKPSEPTSPHWYTTAHLERLIGAYIKNDADNGRDHRTVREFVTEFRGLSGTAKQKRVLDTTGLARAPLSSSIKGNRFDHPKIEKLLAAMKASSPPVKPALIGSISKEHLQQRLAAAGCEMESFEYRRVMETEDDIPWIIETAFAWCPQATQRRLITGVNWSPGIVNPFRELGQFGTSLDTILTRAHCDTNDPVILLLHIACPRVEYTDRGKSALVLT
jgi:hypothetical protein